VDAHRAPFEFDIDSDDRRPALFDDEWHAVHPRLYAAVGLDIIREIGVTGFAKSKAGASPRVGRQAQCRPVASRDPERLAGTVWRGCPAPRT
jgi:hypothetical protein